MDAYAIIMYSLSSFGFFIIIFSLYLLITVPTKLSRFTRFVIHGHDLTSAISQLYLTLGVLPYILFPCASGYTFGLLTQLNVMNIVCQAVSQVILVSITASFSLLLTINRAFAVSSRMEKWKKLILAIFFIQAFAQIIFLLINGYFLRNASDKGRQQCIKIIPYEYPKEMYTLGVDLIPMEEINLLLILGYMVLFATFYLVVSSICGTILIRSIRNQAKSSQSAQFLANQRKLTYGIIYFVLCELIGLGIPIILLALCGTFSVGRLAVSQSAMISISVYPICGPYYVLMSNKDYNEKVNLILKRIKKMTTSLRPHPPAQDQARTTPTF